MPLGQTSPCGAAVGAYAIRPYSPIPDRFRIRFATSLSKTRRVSLRHVAKSKTCRVSRYVVWQSPKPAGFYAMSCGKVQNPPGFALCRVAKSKTRRVSLYVVWQSPKPAGFYVMSCGKVQNPPGFTLCRVAESKTRRVLRYVVWRNAKPVRYRAVGAYCIRPSGVFGRKRMIDTENRRFFLALIIFFSCIKTRKEAKEDQGLTEAGEDGRVRVGVENGILFSSLRRSLTDICLVGASISLRVRFFCRQF